MNRFIRGAVISAAAIVSFAGAADATFLDGYLAECTAVGTGTCTEMTGSTYGRQPISFADAVKGYSPSSIPYSFGNGAEGAVAGRAVFDAPTGGNLILVLPLATAINISPPIDQADVAAIKLTITALAAYQNAKVFYGSLPAATAIGFTADGSVISTGGKDVIRAGVLTAAYPAFDATYPAVVAQTTGFAITTLTNQSAFIVSGAGTLATGSVQLPSAPLDGQSFSLGCAVTVTALTMTALGPATVSATPTTCGPNVGHNFFYSATPNKWFMIN